MKTVAKLFFLVVFTVLLSGFGYKAYSELTTEWETVCYHEVVRRGDTFYDICSHYYNHDNQGESFDEWLTKQKYRNRRLFFKSDGSPRALRCGDIICLEVRERVQKQGGK